MNERSGKAVMNVMMLWALASLPGRGFERRGRYLERSK
jgi:hypothetical protein